MALHVVVGIGGWLAFAGLWVWQIRVFIPARWLDGVTMIAILVAVFAVATPIWVWWNRNIYRRRHRRTTASSKPVQFHHDTLGRSVMADPRVLLNPSEVVVTAEPGGAVKRYLVVAHGGRATAASDSARDEREARSA